MVDGALRRFDASGRRRGEVDAPFGGMLVAVPSVALADWGRGGPCEAVDSIDATEFMCLDDLLSGMLDKGFGLAQAMAGDWQDPS